MNIQVLIREMPGYFESITEWNEKLYKEMGTYLQVLETLSIHFFCES